MDSDKSITTIYSQLSLSTFVGRCIPWKQEQEFNFLGRIAWKLKHLIILREQGDEVVLCTCANVSGHCSQFNILEYPCLYLKYEIN